MKLYKEGISGFLWDTLCEFQEEKLFKNYYLVGGTALSLQMGHRLSDDIDLFTEEELPKEKILRFASRIRKNVEIINNDDTIFQIFFPTERLKVDFVKYPYELISPLAENDCNIRMAGKDDISAMKMSAAGTRGNEAKDFIDLFYLLKEMSVSKVVENFKRKYKTENIEHYLRSMVYFDDVSRASWDSVKMLFGKISADEVKNTLINKVTEYSKAILGIPGI